MRIECTEVMRTFNQELEEADEALANYTPLAGELSLQATLERLRCLGMVGTACGLQAAAEAIGYKFGGNHE